MIFGTRPEIIKLGPVYRELKSRSDASVQVCWTGQHLELADGLLDLFEITIDFTTEDVMTQKTLSEKTGRMMQVLGGILSNNDFDSIIVQGDTVTAMAGAISGFLHRIPLAHVEAGLRTNNLYSPWPEEFARRVISIAGSKHFAPTPEARFNLLDEGIPTKNIIVTGNTVVDALKFVRKKIAFGYEPHCKDLNNLPEDKKLILITGHRRENFGDPMQRVIEALKTLANDEDKHLVFPVHLNPVVKKAVNEHLGHHPNVQLIPPLRYPDFVYLLERAWTVITDSGGIQEEAPSFQMPIVITRDTTERPEVIKSGFGKLVSSDTDLIVSEVRKLTEDDEPTRHLAENPFGDGRSAQRIVNTLTGKKQQIAQYGDEHAQTASL